jgi:hypothetical protein
VRRSFFAPLVLITAVACNSAGPTSSGLDPVGKLDGTWVWQILPNPGGVQITLSLVTVGTNVTGVGVVYKGGPYAWPGSVTITGRNPGSSFDLTIRGDSGFVGTYAGQFMGQDELGGRWVERADSFTVTLHRRR